MPSMVESGPLVLEKKMGKVQDNDNNDNGDDDGQRKNFSQNNSMSLRLKLAEHLS